MSGVSVVIPAYNAELWLAESIDSVLGQTVAPAEVIVVDDGSTDTTARIAESYGAAVTLLRQDNAGPGIAANAGIAAASSEFIGFNDADDVWLPQKLERQLAIFAVKPETDIVGGGIRRFVCPSLDAATAANYTVPPEPEMAWLGPVLLVRADVFPRVGLYDPSLPHGGHHIDWIDRARHAGLVFEMLEEVVCRRRLHPGSLSHRSGAFKQGMLEMARRALARKRHGGGES